MCYISQTDSKRQDKVTFDSCTYVGLLISIFQLFSSWYMYIRNTFNICNVLFCFCKLYVMINNLFPKSNLRRCTELKEENNDKDLVSAKINSRAMPFFCGRKPFFFSKFVFFTNSYLGIGLLWLWCQGTLPKPRHQLPIFQQ